MNLLITGAAGNLGSLLARHLVGGRHALRLLIHRTDLPADLRCAPGVSIYRADLASREALEEPCEGADCVVHFAGVLFAPFPERFLPVTNVQYVRNLVDAALARSVRKFILISFPHVEGESFPARPASGGMDGSPSSVHARTRLEAEKYLFEACARGGMRPVALRPGMIYARGVLMIEAARWLMKRRLMAVWPKPTWIHLFALPDFLDCVERAAELDAAAGVYSLGDDEPVTLQSFLDAAAKRWGYAKPWRVPGWCFPAAGLGCELFASVFRTPSPLTRDFIRIGMASYVCDTSRMKRELLPSLRFPSLNEGLALL